MLYELAECCAIHVCWRSTVYRRTASTTISVRSGKWLKIVTLNPLLIVPTRDVNDIIVLQTAIIGEADVLCTSDEDFYDPATIEFLAKIGIAVLDDIELIKRVRS